MEIAYVNNATEAYPKGQGAPDPSNFYTTNEKKVKCNEAIREDFCRYFSTRERNCEGNEYAERYAYSYLFKSLKDLYSGEIVITGEPSMKPYDQVFLYDSYNDLSGPIEVEQVTHIFSSETGFVTVITPDLVVNCNEIASMSMVDALLTYFTSTWLGYHKPALNSGQVGAVDLSDIPWTGLPNSGTLSVKSTATDKALTGLGAAAPLVAGAIWIPASIVVAFCGLCFFEWARKQFPLRITPLIWKNRPFVCGLDGFTIDTAWGRAKDGAYRAMKGMADFVDQATAALKELM